MAKVYSIAIYKGGTSKTTTAASLIAGLTKRGKKVLGIDLDPQCNLSHYYNIFPEKNEISTAEVYLGKANIVDAVIKTANGYILPGDPALYAYGIKDLELDAVRSAIKPLKDFFDYVIIDTPPNQGILTNNAIIAADEIIIATPVGDFCQDAIINLCESIYTIKQMVTIDAEIAGILVTRKKTRAALSQIMIDQFKEIAAKYDTKVFNTTIRDCQAIQDAQAVKETIFDYSPRSNGAKDYNAFIDELLEGNKAGKDLFD